MADRNYEVGLQCPACGAALTKVVDSRPRAVLIRRRRECLTCRMRFTTRETIVRRSRTRDSDASNDELADFMAGTSAISTDGRPVVRGREMETPRTGRVVEECSNRSPSTNSISTTGQTTASSMGLARPATTHAPGSLDFSPEADPAPHDAREEDRQPDSRASSYRVPVSLSLSSAQGECSTAARRGATFGGSDVS